VPGPRGRSRRARLAGDTAAVTVEVTDAAAGPQAVDDITTTGAGMRLDVGSPGVLSNDIGTNLTVTANTAPGHGSVTMQPNGAFSYTPAVFTGRDSFTYTITDGAGLTSIAIVAVDVTPIATPPTTIQHPDGGGHGTACCVATVATTPTITTTTLARTGGRLDLGLALGLALVALGAALIGGSRLLRRKPF
ncbi:MAG: hypothetical protein JWM05_3500, partial [Acidimicrobiales bacterium]|nr:hypothetical protein [Acidimicrobiales bacterium]